MLINEQLHYLKLEEIAKALGASLIIDFIPVRNIKKLA